MFSGRGIEKVFFRSLGFRKTTSNERHREKEKFGRKKNHIERERRRYLKR